MASIKWDHYERTVGNGYGRTACRGRRGSEDSRQLAIGGAWARREPTATLYSKLRPAPSYAPRPLWLFPKALHLFCSCTHAAACG